MSDTPRTDAVWERQNVDLHHMTALVLKMHAMNLERELNDALLNLKRERGDRESDFKLAKSGRVIKIPVWMDGKHEIISFQAHNVIELERAKDELNAARNEIARLNGQTCYACQCGGTKLDAQERNDWRACAAELAEAMRGSSEILRQSALAKFEKLKSNT